jgi:hypothetical protein
MKDTYTSIEEFKKEMLPNLYAEELLIMEFLKKHRDWYNKILSLAKMWERQKGFHRRTYDEIIEKLK